MWAIQKQVIYVDESLYHSDTVDRVADMHMRVYNVLNFTCPMAELVTASDCYLPASEGREFEPHWGRFIFVLHFAKYIAKDLHLVNVCL